MLHETRSSAKWSGTTQRDGVGVGEKERLKMGIYRDLWLICVIVQQKPTPYCKAFVTESKTAVLTALQANKSKTRC